MSLISRLIEEPLNEKRPTTIYKMLLVLSATGRIIVWSYVLDVDSGYAISQNLQVFQLHCIAEIRVY